jgi:hypothetical protein
MPHDGTCCWQWSGVMMSCGCGDRPSIPPGFSNCAREPFSKHFDQYSLIVHCPLNGTSHHLGEQFTTRHLGSMNMIWEHSKLTLGPVAARNTSTKWFMNGVNSLLLILSIHHYFCFSLTMQQTEKLLGCPNAPEFSISTSKLIHWHPTLQYLHYAECMRLTRYEFPRSNSGSVARHRKLAQCC